MRENRTYGSEGGAAELNRSFLPLSFIARPDTLLPLGIGAQHSDVVVSSILVVPSAR
jgi:hypothetical protein